MKNWFIILLIEVLSVNIGNGQIADPVKWTFDYKFTGNNSVELSFIANIDDKWHMYGIHFPEGGPIPTSFHFDSSASFRIIGTVKEITPPEKKKDPNFDNMEITLHNNKAVFSQVISIVSEKTFNIKGTIEYMTCNDRTCLPPKEKEFLFSIEPKAALRSSINKNLNFTRSVFNKDSLQLETKLIEKISEKKSAEIVVSDLTRSQDNQTLLHFFIIAFLAGLLGAVTPCVYPLIPLTISFFFKGSENRNRSFYKGIIFGFSIILIYTIIGVLVSLTSLGSNFANQLSTHWIPNLLFFLLFLVFAASFLGAFELVLPAGIINKADKQADKGGFIGIIFMALVTVFVSFSCTGPIVGALLVEAAGGLALKPILGMFGFGLAFALPFTFFAIFPASLQSLPKSGNWLNSIKVVLGLFILAFSLKFLVNIDQSYHLNFITRDVFLAVWIIISIILGFYFLGKLKFAHESDLAHVSFTRLILSILAFSFSIYLATGFKGATLSSIASLLPPPAEEFSSTAMPKESNQFTNNICNQPRFSNIFHLPFGLKGYFDYKEGLSCAVEQNKPVLLDFKGHSCGNCKVMEAKVWSDNHVQKVLNENFIIIALYVDDRTKLPEKEWTVSKADGKTLKTIGQLNANLEVELFKTNAQPFYIVADSKGNPLTHPLGMETDVQKFLAFLSEGISNFSKLTTK